MVARQLAGAAFRATITENGTERRGRESGKRERGRAKSSRDRRIAARSDKAVSRAGGNLAGVTSSRLPRRDRCARQMSAGALFLGGAPDALCVTAVSQLTWAVTCVGECERSPERNAPHTRGRERAFLPPSELLVASEV